MELPVNKRIAILINHYKISQKQLSELTGISENTISNAKKGKNIPSLDFFNSIFKAFPNLHPKWLYLGSGPMFVDGTIPEISEEKDHHFEMHQEDLAKMLNILQKEIKYLQVQLKDKEEIIQLLRSKLPPDYKK